MTFREKMIRLDMLLTGHPRARCEHTAQSQGHKLISPITLLTQSEPLYYLSDGGYSRAAMTEEGDFFLTSGSLPLVVERWNTSEVQTLVAEIKAEAIAAIDETFNS